MGYLEIFRLLLSRVVFNGENVQLKSIFSFEIRLSLYNNLSTLKWLG